MNQAKADRQLVLESYIKAVLSFIYTDGQLRLWNAKIQSKIEKTQRTTNPQLDDLVEIKEQVNRDFYKRSMEK